MSLLLRLSTALLFVGGPFFFNPLKSALYAVWGDGYASAYRHFRRDHAHPVNLALHCVALVFQLAGNFCLAHRLDELLRAAGHPSLALLSPLTAASWCVTLVLSARSPAAVTAASIATIGAAFAGAPRLLALLERTGGPVQLERAAFAAFWLALLAAQLCVWATGAAVRMAGARPMSPGSWVPGVTAVLLGWHGGWQLLAQYVLQPAAGLGLGLGLGAAGWETHHVAAAVGATLLVMAAALHNPLVPTVVSGAVLARAAALVTGEPALFLWGCAFTASLLQGVAHQVTGEKATLLSLEDDVANKEQRARFEYSHVVLFPALLLHSLLQSLRTRTRRLFRKPKH